MATVRWPDEERRRWDLASQGRPRLLLAEPGTEPPRCDDCLEDWIRLPAEQCDLDARLLALRVRAKGHGDGSTPEQPGLDIDGVLRFEDRWVSLPPVEARLMEALILRFGAVVRRDHLARAGWPDGAPGRNALDVHVLRLRRRIGQLGLAITTVRSRGYLLERMTSDNGQVDVREA